MNKAKIAIVEDEAIVAEDIRQMLIGMGYEVAGIAATADEALKVAETELPNLVLMDIRIKGARDGIDAAEQMLAQYDIPVVFLTAYADERTLERAKATLPYGYIVKPFEEKDIKTVIETALYRHTLQTTMDTMEAWHSQALRHLPWGVIAADEKDLINYLNPAAERILELPLQDLLGKNLSSYFPKEKNSLAQAVQQTISLPEGKTLTVTVSDVSLRASAKSPSGRLIVFHPSASLVYSA